MANLPTRNILYFGPSRAQFAELLEPMPRIPSARPEAICVDPGGGELWSWRAVLHAPPCVESLSSQFVNLMVVDLRCSGDQVCFARQRDDCMRLLDALDAVDDVETRYPLDHILLLVSGVDDEQVVQTIVEAGGRGIRNVLRVNSCGDASGQLTTSAFADRVMGRIRQIFGAPRRRKRALCAAGGGITGIYFELGALKCLDDCLSNNAINHFDMYFGISAGAVVTSLLAVGYSIDEMMAAISLSSGHDSRRRAGRDHVPTGRLPALDLRLFQARNLDGRELLARLGVALKAGFGTLTRLARGRLPTLETVFLDYSNLVGPPFRTSRFGQELTSALSAPGATNDFRQLATKLYIGATDQDTRLPVLFGDSGYDAVPISQAVQASFAINPGLYRAEHRRSLLRRRRGDTHREL
jgi:predicted acylesterase/phospholipase RssA